MLSKFETKSNRVKGLSFHPKRPWILAALHNGSVQLWDYKIASIVDRFDEHEGPVRGVAFHPTQPLFVSGGDDYKIKVWNWKLRRCLFTLNGHLDYIRTVFFHHEHPWIISCSDDQTIRIWNWQSRNCIAILTGHNHYVMSAQFHPKEDLIVSASLDQTVRIWDISGLRKKHATPGAAAYDQDMHRGQGQADMFGNTDVVVKYVLEGHDRGVNWASFHPNLPLIVSGADDRQIKLWRYNETRAWEVDAFRGHYNNVSCVLFHPRQELVLSNSEDKTISVWDMTKRTKLQTFRQEHDRFWILTAHPELNLFAAGHDGGFVVFKLERERPAMSLHQNNLFYVKDKFIRMHDFASSNDVPVLTIRRGPSGQGAPPRTMSYNPAEHSVIICSAADGGTYEMYNLPREMNGEVRESSSDVKKGHGQAAIFVGRNRFAVLDKTSQQIIIKDLQNTPTKQFKPPAVVNDIFYAGSKNLLLVTPTSVILYDTEVRATISELNINGVRYVVWSPDQSMVALLGKNVFAIANKQLEQLCLVNETIKIKSGTWDEIGIFVYSTLNHIKYALPQGDTGIIRTIEQPMYLTKLKGKSLYCLDRDGKIRVITIDPTEYRFKRALVERNFDEVLHIIRTSNLVGQAIIGYLQKKGYPEIALHFVKDNKTRFELALECGNLDVAIETAKAMDREEFWNMLAVEALRQGNHQVVEMAYQRVKNFDRLSFLYLATGNVEKLKKMLKIAELRGDNMSRYHNALYLGDIEEQIRLMKEVGQYPLAYLSAKTHGLEEEAEAILAASGLEAPPPLPAPGELLRAPAPILRQFDSNWPLLTVSKGLFEGGMLPQANNNPLAAPIGMPDAAFEEVGDWDDDDLDLPGGAPAKKPSPTRAAAADLDGEDGEGEGWGDDDLDLGDDFVPAETGHASVDFVAPAPGPSVTDVWVQSSQLAADHIAAGSFETAMNVSISQGLFFFSVRIGMFVDIVFFQLLNRQVGVVNFAPLRQYFLNIFQSSKAYLACNSSAPALSVPIMRKETGGSQDGRRILPFQPITMDHLVATLREAYTCTSSGKFSQALTYFISVLHRVLFVLAKNASEADEIRQLLALTREYILGLKMEIAKRDPSVDAKRSMELALYFTHCQLQGVHLQLAISSAITVVAKNKNFETAVQLSRRLLEMGPSPDKAQKARKVLSLYERTATNEIELDYNQHNPFVTCAASYTAIYRGSPSVACPLCSASYKPEYSGQLCSICNLALVGSTGTGLVNNNGKVSSR
ncbi:hypothetical protein HDV05_005149 [Chytridiales sp. JEL 0842]|nr:hypothetical protein HDV05_005149 [Chytridiales sp. JEL 0842]